MSLNDALKNPTELRELPRGMNYGMVYPYLDKFINLEKMALIYGWEIPLNGWEKLQNLKEVSFFRFKGQEYQLQYLVNCICKSPNIRKIEIGEGNLQKKLPDLSVFPNLEELNIGFNHHLNIEETLEQLVEQAPNLTHLNLRNLKMREIPSALFKLKKLKSIDFTTNYFKELPPEFAELLDLEEVILGKKNDFWIPRDLEKVFKDFPKLSVEDRKFQLNLGAKKPKEINWEWQQHRRYLINTLNSSLPRVRNKALSILENLFAENFEITTIPTESKLVFIGKMQGSKNDYKEKLKALNIKVDTKISTTTTHIILGEKPAKKVEKLHDSKAIFLTELQFNQFLESADQLYLKEKDSEPLGENLAALMSSADETNEEMAIGMMKKGGVPAETMNDLYLVYQFSTSQKNRRNALKLLKQYGSSELRERLTQKYNPKKGQYPASTIHYLCEATELTAFEVVYGMFKRTNNGAIKNYLLENGSEEVILEVLKTMITNRKNLNFSLSLDKYIKYIKQLPEIDTIGLKIGGDGKPAPVPESIKELKKLKGIRLSGYDIAIQANAFEGLDQLEFLELPNCRLRKFPLALTTIPSLKRLNLRNNYMTELPPEITKLQNLEEILLSSNRLVDFPFILKELPNLKKVILGGMNQMRNRPDVLPEGWRA